jgi:hypothetical protein
MAQSDDERAGVGTSVEFSATQRDPKTQFLVGVSMIRCPFGFRRAAPEADGVEPGLAECGESRLNDASQYEKRILPAER